MFFGVTVIFALAALMCVDMLWASLPLSKHPSSRIAQLFQHIILILFKILKWAIPRTLQIFALCHKLVQALRDESYLIVGQCLRGKCNSLLERTNEDAKVKHLFGSLRHLFACALEDIEIDKRLNIKVCSNTFSSKVNQSATTNFGKY